MATGLFIQVNKMLTVSLDKGLRKLVVKLQLQPMLTSPFFAELLTSVV